jgi:HSP20 family protein
MTLVRMNNRGFIPGRRFQHGIDDMFNWFANELPGYGESNHIPSANILESDEDFKLEVMVPGMKKKDIQIQVENGILEISHDELPEEQDEGWRLLNRGFQVKGFSRKFKLSDRLAAEKINAKYDNGILSIVIPKKEEAKAKPMRKITVA